MLDGPHISMQADDIPKEIPIFPLSSALLLPRGNMSLNIFEPRYLTMVSDALGTGRLVGMIQPLQNQESTSNPALCEIGCLGKITGFQETEDGRFLINLSGICRFHISNELEQKNGYRRAQIIPMLSDLRPEDDSSIDRKQLLDTFQRFLTTHSMETDWDVIEQTENETLITALCMMCPYGPAEKQALLEADSLKERAETLIALTEIALAKNPQDSSSVLQ
ncbi:MAG: LON peptidase substrate-binding domain-containing protein [Nitratireductor sp.]